MSNDIILVFGCILLGVIVTKMFEWAVEDKTWWEEEAEEQGMGVDQYLQMRKLEWENAQLAMKAAIGWIRKHQKKLDRLSRNKKWEFVFEEKYEAEMKKVKGYEEIARLHSAYITILLNKLGATQDNMVSVTAEEIKEAMQKYEARAVPSDGSYSLYCEVIE